MTSVAHKERVERIEFYQTHLNRVSRSFALGIRQLGETERYWVGLSYLLFRLLDTIEDSGWESKESQRSSFAQFRKFLSEVPLKADVEAWATRFPADLPEGERKLLDDAFVCLSDLHELEPRVRQVIVRGVLSMSNGMEHFAFTSTRGTRLRLKSTRETNQYCFFVAGLVGELLTELVAEKNHFPVNQDLLENAFHFGLFLQKVNLLKDQLEDSQQDRFLITDRATVRASVAVHARRSLDYLLAIPVAWREYRIFCAWALYLGLASLPWIDRSWSERRERKIPRTQALLLMEKLKKLIDDNQLLKTEAEKYLGREANDTQVSAGGEIPAWFKDAYLGDLSTEKLLSLQMGDEETQSRTEDPLHKRELLDRMNRAIHSSQAALLRRQRSDGSWVGEVDLNPGPTAQAVMLHAAIGREFPPEFRSGAIDYVSRTQNADGGWSPHEEAPSDVSIACECYTALRFLGLTHDDPRLLKAARFIRAAGVGSANGWTQLYLGVLGILPWSAVQKTPIEILLLPESSPFHVANLSYWVKAIVIPMALVGDLGPGTPHPLAREIAIELGVEPSEYRISGQPFLFDALSPAIDAIRRLGLIRTLRETARSRAWKWIGLMTEASGDFGGNTCTAINVLLAMKLSGKADAADFERGYEAFMSYAVRDKTSNEWRMQCCQSHVWDTALATKALGDSLLESDETVSSALLRGRKWLRQREIRDVRGPWARTVEAEPAAWCFGNHHDLFPVTDCTAVALLAIAGGADPDSNESGGVEKAVDWLIAMQGSEGGWAAYEKPTRAGGVLSLINKIARFKDIENALVDHPKADVSAKVVEALSKFRGHHPGVSQALIKARRYLLSSRETNGLWRGNYGINYIYGTAFVCTALRSIDQYANPEWAPAASEFFLTTQNDDGGWGESDLSYTQPQTAGRGARSSALQTAWALQGLANCMAGTTAEISALSRASKFLIDLQLENGEWAERHHQGTVFPGKVYFRYELYPLYFPLTALSRAREVLLGESPLN